MKRWIYLSIWLMGIAQGETPWRNLIEPSGLNGWQQRGGTAKYENISGTIIGEAVANTPNSFLCTKEEFADFELEFEFLLDEPLNSGVQIRSQAFPEEKTLEIAGKSYRIPAGRVHGYQVELDIDPARGRWKTAGIYEEGVRGWLYPGPAGGNDSTFAQTGKTLYRKADWNHVRVVADGGTITTYWNGTLRATVVDSRVTKGFIGLQVHQIGKDLNLVGKKIQWRNIRIRNKS